jgi:hypothetical protein
MHADGGGLYLQVTTTAAGQLNKSWLFRYGVGGRERQMGLGSLTEVKLADARQAAAECRQQRQDGIDPIEAREGARRSAEACGVTFRQAFEAFFSTKCKTLSSRKHAAQWQSTMEETYVFPISQERSEWPAFHHAAGIAYPQREAGSSKTWQALFAFACVQPLGSRCGMLLMARRLMPADRLRSKPIV